MHEAMSSTVCRPLQTGPLDYERIIMLRHCTCAAVAALLSIAGAAQAEPRFPPGSSIGIELPAAFSPADGVPGFLRADNTSFVLAQMPTQACEPVSTAMRTPEAVARQQIELKGEPRELAVMGVKAQLTTGVQTTQLGPFAKWIVVACTDKLTALVMAQTPGHPPAEAVAKEIEAALLTLVARP